MAVPLKGESVDYCLECAEKHIQTAKVLIREAIQRAEQCLTQTTCEPCCIQTPYVLEKIRDAVAELTGCEDDTSTALNVPHVREINRRARELRRKIWQQKLSFGHGTLNDLKQLYKELEELADFIYNTPEISGKYDQVIAEVIQEEYPNIPNMPQVIPDMSATQKRKQAKKERQEKRKQMKKLIKELAKPTPEELEELERKYHINKLLDLAELYKP